MQPPSAYHVLVRTANDTAVVEGQAIALSLRYEERPKRIPLLIRLSREVARCLALKGTQQPTIMNDQQQRVLVSVPGGEGGLGLIIDCALSGTFEGDGYSWPWYRYVYSFGDSCRLGTLTRVEFALRRVYSSSPHRRHGGSGSGRRMASSLLCAKVLVWI